MTGYTYTARDWRRMAALAKDVCLESEEPLIFVDELLYTYLDDAKDDERVTIEFDHRNPMSGTCVLRVQNALYKERESSSDATKHRSRFSQKR